MKSTAAESTLWENSLASADHFFFSPTSVLRAVLKYSDLTNTHFKGITITNFSAHAPHAENEGMCFDNLPLGAGREAEVPFVPGHGEVPQLGHQIRLVNAHPDLTQDLINCCWAI